MIQNLKSNHGFPRACRNNITQLAVVGHVKDKAELDDVYGSVAGEIDKEQFYEAYHYCTKEPHGVMVCDLHPKKPGQYLRKNLDEILVFDKKVNIET